MTYFRLKEISAATAKTFYSRYVDPNAVGFPACQRWYMVDRAMSLPGGYDYQFAVAQADGMKAILGLVNVAKEQVT